MTANVYKPSPQGGGAKKEQKMGVAGGSATIEPEGMGDRLRRVRGDRSVERMAAELAVHRNTLMRYEKHLRQPDVAFLRRVVEKNPGWSIDWLVTGQGDERLHRSEEDVRNNGGNLIAAQPSPRYGALDAGLLAAILQALDDSALEHGAELSAAKRADIIVIAYPRASAIGVVDRAEISRLVKLTLPA